MILSLLRPPMPIDRDELDWRMATALSSAII
jgi:hypothetical protein